MRRAGPSGPVAPFFSVLLKSGVAAAVLLLAACQSEPMGGPLALEVSASNPVSALQRVNNAGAKCWIRSGDRRFRGLYMIPELDTAVGKPRLLILRSDKKQGLPLLVIEASGPPTKIVTYGPLASGATGARVNADIMRWSSGPDGC
ncbi:hypothetical protein [Nitratireductor pacificus]|uniref:Lipoprotein n=1 Tax=Nitratireductor pacificus pht-3B TaxID=391937 RepID=K2MQU4_9HYPH|nr:hypothetical protein [Nitratireductor pacificus]EKF19692.1 lipoprotein [Nitratireductor pacificus pht-3B]